MKKLFLTSALAILFLQSAFAQTNVSGGIYSNAIWTLANSPYIVTDTVVVFPGVTLTIQPGVVVKFDNNKRLEIRQATLSAQGTSVDSITFTSNSASPFPGICSGIYLNGALSAVLNHCNFLFSTIGVWDNYSSMILKNSTFNHNEFGLLEGCNYPFIDSCRFLNNTQRGMHINGGMATSVNKINHCFFFNNSIGLFGGNIDTIMNCVFDSNQIGIQKAGHITLIMNCIVTNNTSYGIANSLGGGGGEAIINNCQIDFNDIGIYLNWQYSQIINSHIGNNNIGVQNDNVSSDITGCVIENNSIGIQLLSYWSGLISCNKICNNTSLDFDNEVPFGFNMDIPNNYWCTTDSATVALHIHDGYDNINLGLVHFMPLDTQQCYLTGCTLALSAVGTNAGCGTCNDGSAIATPSNGTAPYTYTWYTVPLQTTQTATNLPVGTYTVCVVDANGCTGWV